MERGSTESRPTILLVEDNDDIAVVYAEILRTLGYDVITARDGESALRVFDDPAHGVALLLTDLTMPRMSGTDVVRALRERGIETPVIMLSGYPAPPGEAARGDVAAWLQKPLEVEELLGAVERVLGARRRGQ